MTPISTEDIDEMRRNGFEAETIHRAEDRLALYQRGLELVERIAAAFRGVSLGGGVGLQHAIGLDDHEDEETLAKWRNEDEKESWERIPPSSLHFGTAFFDAEGMRFHLPAYLIAELRGQYGCDIVIPLTDISEFGREQFRLLDAAQRSVVREFLLLALDDAERVDHEKIDAALAEYWTGDGGV